MKFCQSTLFLLLLLTSFCAKAQLRIFGGPQMSTANYEVHHVQQETESKYAFAAGLGLTTLIEGPLYFSPSLSYSQIGYKVSFSQRSVNPDSGALNNNTTIRTIAFAPLLQFNFSKSASHFFLRFGPGFDFALSGKEAFDSTGGKRIERSMLFGSQGYSPVTAYAALQFGFVHRSGFTLFANYEHGLSNLNNADNGPIILNRVAGVSIGYQFGKK